MADVPATIKAPLLGRGTLYTAWSSLRSPELVEVLARSGLEGVALDCQHGGWDSAHLFAGIAAIAAARQPIIVRVPLDGYGEVSKALDLGAQIVIAPMVNNVSDARRYAACAKYPPLGARSWGPNRALMLSGTTPADYLARANDETCLLVMIETREALANLDDILAVPGVDGVFVGPSDLSVTLSDGRRIGPTEPDVIDVARTVLGASRRYEKLAGVFAITPEGARDYGGMGYDLVAVASDAILLKAGVRAALDVIG